MPRRFLSDAIELPSLSAAPATPAAGRVLLYARAGSMKQKTSAGTETALDAAGGGGGSLSVKTVETNFGVMPRWSGSFVVIDAAISVDSKIIITQAIGPYTAKGTLADEASMYGIVATARSEAGQMTVYWKSDSPVKSYVKFNYMIGVAA